MSKESVREYFMSHDLEDRILVFSSSCATVALAAHAAGVAAGQIAKSLTFWVGQAPIMVVMAGDHKVDNAKYKDQFGRRPKMLSREEVEEEIGHGVGEVCPFVIKEGVAVYLDSSLQRYDKVYPAAGSDHSLVGLTLEELEMHSHARSWIDVGQIG